ncbi:MAG: carbohydrate ABC transporter permease [Oliverpabstia sp.]
MKKNKKTTFSLYSYKLLMPILFLYVLFFILPSIMGIGYSFTNWRADSDVLEFIGFKNFTRIFQDRTILLAIKNTFIYTVFTVIGKNLAGLVLATFLNVQFKSKNILRGIFYLPSILSTVAIGVVFTSVLHPTGPLNNMLGSIGLSFLQQNWLDNRDIVMYSIGGVAVWMMAGYHMTIYLAGYQSIPNDYYEAAKIDGANAIQRFFCISVPMLRPSFNMNIMLSLIAGLKVFTEVFVMTGGGPGNASQVLSTLIYKSFGNGSWGLGTAMNIILTVVVSVLTIPILIKMRREEVES